MVTDYSHALLDLAAIRKFYEAQAAALGNTQWTLSKLVADVLGEAAYVHCLQSVEGRRSGRAGSLGP